MTGQEDIDDLLGRLRDMPLDPRLGMLDSTVFESIDRARAPAVSRAGIAIIALVSLGLGLGGTLVPATSSSAAAVTDLLSPGPLAPSSLLGGSNE